MEGHKGRLWIIWAVCCLFLLGCSNKMAEKEAEKQDNNSKQDQEQVANNVNKEGFPITKDTLELTMMAPNLGLAEWADMPLIQDYEKKTNIKLSFQTPPQSEFSTKFNLAFASGELPDIIYAGGPNTLNDAIEVDYGQQGLLVPLEDYLEEYAPNFYKLMKENPEIEKSITTGEGHIYALPHITKGPTSQWIMGPM